MLAQLQQASILHLDETPWYQKGKLYWLWVAIESKTAVFRIAPRTKEQFQHLGKKVKHKKLKALASEILDDWDAVIAAVNNPDSPFAQISESFGIIIAKQLVS